MKRLLLVSTCILAIQGAALAQTEHVLAPFGIRGGYSYLTDHDSRGATSNNGWTVGASYDFYQGKMNERYSFDVDYDRHNGNGNTIDTWAFQVAARIPVSSFMGSSTDTNRNNFYVGAGLGLFRHHLSADATPLSGSFSETKSRFGGEVLAGVQFAQNANVEIYYRLSDKIDGVNCNTVGIELGWHF